MTAYAFQISKNYNKRWPEDEPPGGPDWDILRRIFKALGSLGVALIVWGLIVGIFCVGG